jgi:hypothetical protein
MDTAAGVLVLLGIQFLSLPALVVGLLVLGIGQIVRTMRRRSPDTIFPG